MQWRDIAARDPYLAGSLTARGWQWWEERTAESEADSVGLQGEAREKFLRGWKDEVAEEEQERKEQMFREYEEMAEGYEKGDPAR